MKKQESRNSEYCYKNNKDGWKSFIFPVILALCLFAVIFASGYVLVSKTAQTTHQNMERQLHVSAETINTKIEGLYESIEATAPLMAYEAGYTKEQILFAMNSLRDAHGFDFIVRTNSDGIAMNYLGKENIDLSQRDYVHTALTGARAIELISSGAYDTDNSYVILAVPIIYDDTVIGVLHGSYQTSHFVSLLTELTDEFGKGCDEICILSSEGMVIASSSTSFDSDVLNRLAKGLLSNASLSAHNSYTQEIEVDGQNRYYYFHGIDAGLNSGWYIASRMSQNYLSEQTSFALYSALALMVVAIAITAALLAIVFSRQRLSNELKSHSVVLTEALAAAEKADIAKGQFLSRMSHEIRTPLNAVIGYNTIARNEMVSAQSDDERRRASMKVMDCLTKSDIAGKHLLSIINDVLDMSAIESGKIQVVNERFDFRGLITSLTTTFYSQAKSKSIDFEVLFESDMDEWIVGDQMRVNQVLMNLLSNAVKFTPHGGNITLCICPDVRKDNINVRFDVQDTGIGISDEAIERLWKPFEQADSSISRRFGGTGLGLSITKLLIELMGGKISVTSTPGKGTTFTVDLTFTRTEQPQEQGFYDFSDINVLIVDDDISTCDYIRLLLNRNGVRNTGVTSGKEAIAVATVACNRNDPYTLCLIDWNMPSMDGIETVIRIRNAVGEHLPIIVITAYDFDEVADKAAELGVNMLLPKPLFQSSLFNLLANISNKQVQRELEKPTLYNFPNTHILLVEDTTMNMEIALRILESAGITADCAWNGLEAVTMFKNTPVGTYDAIIMDVQMPIMDGYTATKKIRQLRRKDAATIPIIAMTADAFAENIAESLSAGMNDHISKPVDVSLLFKTLAQYIKSSDETK